MSLRRGFGEHKANHRRDAEDTLLIMQLLYGLHAVEEAIRSGNRRLESVVISRQRQDMRLSGIAEACQAAGIPVRTESKEQLTRLAHTDAHQGVVAIVAERGYASLETFLRATGTIFSCWRWTASRILTTWERF